MKNSRFNDFSVGKLVRYSYFDLMTRACVVWYILEGMGNPIACKFLTSRIKVINLHRIGLQDNN